MKRLTPARCLTIDRLDAKQHVKTSSKSTFSILFPVNPILHSHFSVAIESPSWSSSTTIFPNKDRGWKSSHGASKCACSHVHEETNPARLRQCPLGPCRHYKSVLIEESSLGPQWIKQQFPFSQKTAGEGTWTLHIWLRLIPCKRTKGFFTRRRKREEHIITHSAGWCWKTTAGAGWKQRVQTRKLETQKSWSW